MKHHTPYIYKSYIILALGVLLLLSGCKSAELKALENLVSNMQLTKGHEVKRFLQDNGRGFITGQIYYPEVNIVYEPINNYTKKDVYDEIVTILKKNNWQYEVSTIPGYSSATWQSDDRGYKEAFVTIGSKNLVGLSITSRPYPINTATATSIPAPQVTYITPELDISLAKIKGRDGMTLLYVPAGEFIMGSDNGELHAKPAHTVYLDAFWIDQTEVTNELYAKCVDAGQCSPPGASTMDYFSLASYAKHPVVYVDWEMANAYCSWAGRRLPTEAEWEKAARGTDARTYPWGEGIDCYTANYRKCVGETTPVGSYEKGKSPYGAYDMAGNVWEWVNYQNPPSSNPQGPDLDQYRPSRGGNWTNDDFETRSASRGKHDSSGMSYYGGFRCASSLP